MKHYVFNLLTLSILFFASCKNSDSKTQTETTTPTPVTDISQYNLSAGADKELVAQMESEISRMQNLMPEFKATNDSLLTKRMLIKQSYSGGTNTPTYQALGKIYGRLADGMSDHEGFRTLTGKLIALSADHASGKVKAEDAKKQYEEIKKDLDQKVERFSKVKAELGGIDQEIKKIFSDANIKAAGGK